MALRHLRYFLAVGEALNFTKAATQLRVAQPALSRQVQDREDEIGVDLLKRSPRGVTLTTEGKLFMEEVRAPLQRAEASVDEVRALAGELETGSGVGIVSELAKHIAGKRLVYRPLSNSREFHSVGIARAAKGDVTPAGEKFCEASRTSAGATKIGQSNSRR